MNEKMKKIMANLKYVVIHAGNPHLDEFMAVALVMAVRARLTGLQAVNIYRRDPTEAEIEDPAVLVADVGGVHDSSRLNFDHHQFGRNSAPESAMGLVASWLGIRERVARLFPWFETRVALDSYGPFATAKGEGTDWSVVSKFLGPAEELILDRFVQSYDCHRWEVVEPLAKMINAKLDAEERVTAAIQRWATAQGVRVIDFTSADPADVDAVSDAIVAEEPDGVAIFKDKRGPGHAFLRIKDDPRVDFSRAKDLSCMAFCHANGFYATTKEPVPRAAVAYILGYAYVA